MLFERERTHILLFLFAFVRKDNVLSKAKFAMSVGGRVDDYETAIKLLTSISGWKDADEQIIICQQEIEKAKAKIESDRLEKEQQIKQQTEAEQAKTKRANTIVVIFMIIATIVFFCLCLFGKDPATYTQAVQAMENKNYLEALEKFESLGTYEDSPQKMIECLELQIDDYLSKSLYNDALGLAKKYQDLNDNGKEIYIETEERIDDFKKYDKSIVTLYGGQPNQWRTAIDQLKSLGDVKNARNLVSSYETISKSPFLGRWVSGPNKSKIGTEYMSYITVDITFRGGEFCLALNHKTCNVKDLSTAILDSTYHFDSSDIQNNSIEYGKFKWQISGNSLIETDAGSKFTYTKR